MNKIYFQLGFFNGQLGIISISDEVKNNPNSFINSKLGQKIAIKDKEIYDCLTSKKPNQAKYDKLIKERKELLDLV